MSWSDILGRGGSIVWWARCNLHDCKNSTLTTTCRTRMEGQKRWYKFSTSWETTSLESDWDIHSSSSMSEQSVPRGDLGANYDWALTPPQANVHPSRMFPAPAPALPTPSFHDMPQDKYYQPPLSPRSTPVADAPVVASARAASNRSAVMNFSWTPTTAATSTRYEADTVTGVPARTQQSGGNNRSSVRQFANTANEPAWSMQSTSYGQKNTREMSRVVMQYSPSSSHTKAPPATNAGRDSGHPRGVGTGLQGSPSYQSKDVADGSFHHQQTTLQVPGEVTSGGVVAVPVQQSARQVRQSGNDLFQRFAPKLSHSSVEGTTMQHSIYISSFDVMPYVSVDDFADIIRKLYLPYEVPRWQQLVRAAVLVVGLVEELHRNDGYTGLHHVVHNRDYVSPTEWIPAWLDLQPRSRFSGPKPSVLHPRMLLYPANTTLDDWGMFLTHPRQVVFRVLLGLRSCSPYVTYPTMPALMSQDDWAAWADDVLWVMFQVLNHVKSYKTGHDIPSRRTSDAQAPQGSRPLPAARRGSAVDGAVVSASSSGTQSLHTPNAYTLNAAYTSNASLRVDPEPREHRKRTLDDPEESDNKRLKATELSPMAFLQTHSAQVSLLLYRTDCPQALLTLPNEGVGHTALAVLRASSPPHLGVLVSHGVPLVAKKVSLGYARCLRVIGGLMAAT
ncbi:hypothetical protein C8T65DRAFT_699023 [Cerioporus squamosus]|nr:hypothetical protein C8T65DRAFT_699023 [Cerioporus squamosus]